MTQQFLTAKDLAAIFRVNRRTITRWSAQGVLPPGYKISRGSLRWKLAEIQQMINALGSRFN